MLSPQSLLAKSPPNPILAAIVFSIGLRLVAINGIRSIFKSHREEFYLAIFTAATVVFVGVKEGIILAIMLSLILHVCHWLYFIDSLARGTRHALNK